MGSQSATISKAIKLTYKNGNYIRLEKAKIHTFLDQKVELEPFVKLYFTVLLKEEVD